MFELGKAANGILSEHALAEGKEKRFSPMTLSDKILALFEQLRMPVFCFLLRKTRDAGEAEDLTQEAFLRLCRHLHEERPLDNPKAWLLTVANNLAIDQSRGDSVLSDLDENAWQQIDESKEGRQANPERTIIQQERMDLLHKAVLNLTSLQRECLHLRAEGLRYREIAELMGLSMSTVVDAVRRATVNLAREIGSEASV